MKQRRQWPDLASHPKLLTASFISKALSARPRRRFRPYRQPSAIL